jgi:hypothetical protein
MCLTELKHSSIGKMISLFFFLLSSLCCVIGANIIHNHSTRIVDIVHDNLPPLNAPYISDILILFQTVTTVTLINKDVLSEMFLIMGIVQICRFLCFISTILPPLKNYHDKYRLGGINGNGSEYIFSGHASYSALCTIYLYTHNIISGFPLIAYNLTSQFLIIVTRNHYTVDIILAWIIVPLIYGNIFLCHRVEWCNTAVSRLL